MDFFTVAQHEIGHSLGLSHSPVSDSVMYPYYKGKQGNQGVGYDDVLAMYELYSKYRCRIESLIKTNILKLKIRLKKTWKQL